MRNAKLMIGVCFALLSIMGPVQAGMVTVQGEIRNIDADGDTFSDDLKISRIRFDVTTGTTVTFDSLVWEYTNVDLNGDGFITGFDNYMDLLTDTGSYLTHNDDYSLLGSFDQNGSVHQYDSAFQHTFGTGGTYMVTIGQFNYSVEQAFQGFAPNIAFYDYTQLNLPPVPVKRQDWAAWTLDIRWDAGSVSNVIALDDSQVSAVPEPTSLALLGLGLAGLGFTRRRKAL